jgi:hypothetical protein
MTDDFRRDTLPDLAFGLRIDRYDKVGMSFDVDKTRCDYKTVGVNHLNGIVREGGAIAVMRPEATAMSPMMPGLPLPSMTAADRGRGGHSRAQLE